MRTIRFKSIPENWIKEYLGLKQNTIRLQDSKNDVRFEILNDFINRKWNTVNVEIYNSKTGETFTRTIIDVTKFDKYYIISWRHK